MRFEIEPSPLLDGVDAYRPPRSATPTDLRLDGNEGPCPPAALLESMRHTDPGALRRYPDTGPLQALLAEEAGVTPDRILVTAGADDALERAIRAVLAPGRELVLPVPTFGMIERYARLAGARVHGIPWLDGALPVDAMLDAVTDRTAMIAVVTPNSPTGLAATMDELRRLSAAAPGALLLVDLAYVEFAQEDLTRPTLALPNAVVTRTFSKAWGLAGLRVGWAAGPAPVMEWMRAAGHPYAVASPSLSLAIHRLSNGRSDMRAFAARVRWERDQLVKLLVRLGASTVRSQGNFVLGRFADAGWVRDGLAGLGVAVRAFPGQPLLGDALRITTPGEEQAFQRLESALETVLAPQALLFDLDDTLVDTSQSYRRAIAATAATFGVELGQGEIGDAKAAGDANDDWALTRRLMAARGVDRPLAEVTRRFEALYQGDDQLPGLRQRETLLLDRTLLSSLAARRPLAIVTGRPRADAQRCLDELGIADRFAAVVSRDDAPLKPDPAPVQLALQQLGVRRAWMVGDTPDDVHAARNTGVVPLGVVPPLDDRQQVAPELLAAGAARVLEDISQIEELLP